MGEALREAITPKYPVGPAAAGDVDEDAAELVAEGAGAGHAPYCAIALATSVAKAM